MSNYGRIAQLNFTELEIGISNDKSMLAIEIEDDTDEGDLLILSRTIPSSNLRARIFGILLFTEHSKSYIESKKNHVEVNPISL